MLGLNRKSDASVTSTPAGLSFPELGELLQRRRVAAGKTISEIASITRIQPAFLRALEAGDVSQCPGPFFTVSFLRQYASILGFDSDETVDFEEKIRIMMSMQAASDKRAQSRSGQLRVPGTFFLGLRRIHSHSIAFLGRHLQVWAALGLIAAGISAWWLVDRSWLGEAEAVNTERLGEVEPSPAVPPLGSRPAGETALEPRDPAPRLGEPSLGLPGTPPAGSGQPVQNTPPGSRPQFGPSQANLWSRQFRVVVVATSPVWVRWKVDSSAPKESIVRPGTPLRFRVADEAFLTTGNDSYTSLQIDGMVQNTATEATVGHYRITNGEVEPIKPGSF